MQQIFIELWSYKGPWRDLSVEDRAAYIHKLGPVIEKVQAEGVEILAWGYNEADIDRRVGYDVFAVYRLPDRAMLKALQASIAESGWYDLFEHVNAGGAALPPPQILQDHIMLRPLPVTAVEA